MENKSVEQKIQEKCLMKPYIGTKVLKAKPMTREEYNELRGWSVPPDENPDDAGYLTDNGAGHLQWQPKDVFEDAFSPFDGMDFGMAIAALKRGLKVARSGWNGKGMWLVLVLGTADAELREGSPYRNALHSDRCEILPHIDMWTTNNQGRRAMLPGWLASQTDMLAEDWVIVE